MVKIKKEDIYRFHVCAWAYGWTNEQLHKEIQDFICEKQWEYFFKQKEEEEKTIKLLIEEIGFEKQQIIRLDLLEPQKNRGYGDKYIKRKFR